MNIYPTTPNVRQYNRGYDMYNTYHKNSYEADYMSQGMDGQV